MPADQSENRAARPQIGAARTDGMDPLTFGVRLPRSVPLTPWLPKVDIRPDWINSCNVGSKDGCS
jgi:hypothetical protein